MDTTARTPPDRWVLPLILALGAFLRFHDIGVESLWLDEAFSISCSSRATIRSVVETAYRANNHPPLYFIVLRFWMHLFGSTEQSVRSLSAILGLASIVPIYRIGRYLFDTQVGLLAGFLSAISLFHIRYSQEARSYALLLLLIVLSFDLFVTICKCQRPRRMHFVLLALVNGCLLYTHIYGAFAILSQIGSFLVFRPRDRTTRLNFALAQAITAGLFFPCAFFLFRRVLSLSKGFWIPPPTLDTLLKTVRAYAGSAALANLYIPFLVLGCLPKKGLRSWRKAGKWSPSSNGLRGDLPENKWKDVSLVVAWLVGSTVVPFGISQVLYPVYVTKYSIGASAAGYLLVARALGAGPIAFRVIMVSWISILAFGPMRDYYRDDVKEQWREAADLIDRESHDGDVVVICNPICQTPFDYYYKGDAKRVGMLPRIESKDEITAALENAITGHKRFWLVLSHTKRPRIVRVAQTRYGSKACIMHEKLRGIDVLLFELDDRPKVRR